MIRQYEMHLVFNNTTRLANSFLNWRFRSCVTATLNGQGMWARPDLCNRITTSLFRFVYLYIWGSALLKSHLFSSVKWWYLFSKYRFEIFDVAWQGLLHLLWKISCVYVIAARLCEHLNLVKFEKRAAKTLQHGYGCGNNILILYDIIITYGGFFCYSWHEWRSCSKLLDFSSIYYFLVKYAFWISNMNELLPHPLLCWYTTSAVGGLRSENQLILGNAKQYSDMKFLNISR